MQNRNRIVKEAQHERELRTGWLRTTVVEYLQWWEYLFLGNTVYNKQINQDYMYYINEKAKQRQDEYEKEVRTRTRGHYDEERDTTYCVR